MNPKPTTADAYRLLREGSLALADVEEYGIRIDVGRLKNTIRQTSVRIREVTDQLKADPIWQRWKRRFGPKANLGSKYQLAKVLQGEGYPIEGNSVDAEKLLAVDCDFARSYRQNEKLKKLKGTYLKGVLREVVDSRVHAVFSLHLARTYRGSASAPNVENVPTRDPEIARPIREVFIPDDGCVFMEFDYAQLEVRVAACYNRDKRLIRYILDPTKDMHRDMAAECYMLPIDQVTKEARTWVKNQFVFPEFYGSYFKQVAPGLWNAILRNDLKTVDGVPLIKHLKQNGVKRLGDCVHGEEAKPGTFERHIAEVERRFWGDRFKTYAQWKLDWFDEYKQTGGFQMLTGFRCDGVFKRNDVINYPVQGGGFHCLLWSIIQIGKWLRKSKLRSRIVNQIHDSIVMCVHRSEIAEVVPVAMRIMTKDLLDHWDWIIVPMEVEPEICEINWFEKVKYKP